MINHVRTLLLNVDGSAKPGYSYPGEEFVPNDYRAVTLPSHLNLIRSILFSSVPDRLMLNYRLSQFTTLLHSTPLETYVTENDTRITYSTNTSLFDVYVTPWEITQIAGSIKPLYLIGDLYSLRDRDKLLKEYVIEVVDGTHVKVTPVQTGIAVTSTYTTSGSLSSVCSLPDSGVQFRFESGSGSKWRLRLFYQPTLDLGDVLANLSFIDSEEVTNQLFGNLPTGNYATWHEVWTEHDELGYRLSALLLALASRTDELRKGT